MTKDQQLAVLRRELQAHGVLTFDDRRAVGRWSAALAELQDSGFCTCKLIALDEQSTIMEVRINKGGGDGKSTGTKQGDG